MTLFVMATFFGHQTTQAKRVCLCLSVWLQLVIWVLLSVALWWLDCVLSGGWRMWRVCDSRWKGVCDGHSAGHDAFNGWWEATSWQVNYSWGVPWRRERWRKLSYQSRTKTEKHWNMMLSRGSSLLCNKHKGQADIMHNTNVQCPLTVDVDVICPNIDPADWFGKVSVTDSCAFRSLFLLLCHVMYWWMLAGCIPACCYVSSVVGRRWQRWSDWSIIALLCCKCSAWQSSDIWRHRLLNCVVVDWCSASLTPHQLLFMCSITRQLTIKPGSNILHTYIWNRRKNLTSFVPF